jgi:citrate synthase
MAIPSWLWPGNDSSSRTPDRLLNPETTNTSEIEDVSNLFELLSNETRLEILRALHSRTDRLSYTELRRETSIEDKGKFNYHLRQLSDFIDRQEGEYRLTAKGDRISQNIADDRYLFDSD